MKVSYKNLRWNKVEKLLYRHKLTPENVEKYGWASEPTVTVEEVDVGHGSTFYSDNGFECVINKLGECGYSLDIGIYKKRDRRRQIKFPRGLYNVTIEQEVTCSR